MVHYFMACATASVQQNILLKTVDHQKDLASSYRYTSLGYQKHQRRSIYLVILGQDNVFVVFLSLSEQICLRQHFKMCF